MGRAEEADEPLPVEAAEAAEAAEAHEGEDMRIRVTTLKEPIQKGEITPIIEKIYKIYKGNYEVKSMKGPSCRS